jgi:phosphatidylserine/phosphatidylglycerophosphate/cardiolipin synthase-like enzyme
VVSPENARERLTAFIGGARKQLLIYDPQISDDAMLRLLVKKIEAGVEVRVIGRIEAKWRIPFEKYPGKRLHVRAIVRDGAKAFVGSQSLRRPELDKRREVGVIINDKQVVRGLIDVFEKDWAQTGSGKNGSKNAKAQKKNVPDAA